jgi:UDP-N-acetylglucosamine 2-epimerase
VRKIVTVVGNRAQLVRSAVLSPAFRGEGLTEIVVWVGSEEWNEAFIDLGRLGTHRSLHVDGADINWMTLALTGVLFSEDPQAVVVSGDAPCTLAGARSAVRAGIPLAHIEAGIRGRDPTRPEERVRTEVDRIASWLFCPHAASASTVRDEGASGEVFEVGDVLLDAANELAKLAHRRHPVARTSPYALALVRRVENASSPRLERIIEGLNRLHVQVLFPASVTLRARLIVGPKIARHVQLIEPTTYLETRSLLSQARVVVTDSGVVQREAYWSGVPCVTLRSSTEWVETVSNQANTLVDDDPDAIAQAVRDARMPKRRPRLYGDGRAAPRVAQELARALRR